MISGDCMAIDSQTQRTLHTMIPEAISGSVCARCSGHAVRHCGDRGQHCCEHVGVDVVNILVAVFCSIMSYFRTPSDAGGR